MAIRLSSVMAILFATWFLSTGQGLHQALIPLAAEHHFFSQISISLLASVYFGGYLAGCIFAPALIKRVGHSRTLAIAAASLSALSLFHVLMPNEVLWILFRVMVGLAFATTDLVMESWLAASAENQDRGKLLSIYRLIDLGSLGLGQFLIASASPGEFLLFALVAICVSVTVVIVLASTAPTPPIPQSVSVRFWHVYTVSPLAVIGSLLHGIASGIYWGYAPLIAEDASDSDTAVGVILAATLIGAALAQYPVGWVSDKYDRRKMLIWLSAMAAVFSVIIALLSGKHPELMGVLMFFYGATSFCIYPLVITYAFDRTNKEEFVEVGAAVLMAYGVGAFAGPLLAPLASFWGEMSLVFLIVGLSYTGVFGFALYRSGQSSPVEKEETVKFVPMPASTQQILDIDPRRDPQETEIITGRDQ
ncbi:MAG: MFS transporter [Rhodospirillaceae bacterium]